MGKYTPIPSTEAIPRPGSANAPFSSVVPALLFGLQMKHPNVTDTDSPLPIAGMVVFINKDGTIPNRASNLRAENRDHMIARRQPGSSPGEVTAVCLSVAAISGVDTSEPCSSVHPADLDDECLVAHPDHHAAFSILYERYAPSILRYCHLRISNLADAEDTTASILLKAFTGFPPDRRSTFRAWLFTIAHHTVVDFYRRSARTPATSLDLDAADQVADNSQTPEEHILRHDEEATLRCAMSHLNDDQRQVIELRLAGLKGAEIATVLERSHNAVKMLQHRALHRLRIELTTSPTTSSKETLDEI